MCGIACIFNIKEQTPELRQKALTMAKRIRHRGPDWSGIYCGGSAILAHERLSIVDPQSGGQPLYSPDRRQVLAVNGEIYNHRDLRADFAGEYQFQTGSDCEVILALYRRYGTDFIERLSGIFAFALYDEERDEFLIARDPIGVIPLYIGRDTDGTLYCASELKALEGLCDEYEPFLPGHYYWSREGKMRRWYRRDWTDYDAVRDRYASLPTDEAWQAQVADVRTALEAAVRRQLMSDVPYGVLLSGGLDSSVISAVAKLYADRRMTAGRLVAPAPLLRRGPERRARPGKSPPRCRAHRHRPPRNPLHHPGGAGRHPRRHLLHRDLRRHHRARLHADVPAGTRHQVDGHQDGAQR